MSYDTIIVGSGPAGLAASVFAGRAGLETLILEKNNIGGELPDRDKLWSYPGFPEGISGAKFRNKLVDEVEQHDPELILDEVTHIGQADNLIITTDSTKYETKTVVISVGCRPKKLEVEGAEAYRGRGVFNCAKCDGPLYSNEKVAVVGHGDFAAMDSIYLADFAKEVLMISDEPKLSADPYFGTKVKEISSIKLLFSTKISEIYGDGEVMEGLKLHRGNGSESQIHVDGLCVQIGRVPNTEFIADTIPLDEDGKVIVNNRLESDVEGVFAAGDVRQNSSMDVASAVGDGSLVINSISQYISSY